MSEPLAVIVASVRAGRIGPDIARWFVGKAEQAGRNVDLLDLAGIDLPGDLAGGGDATKFAERVARADSVVVVTPEYNHGYPGALKTAIDTADVQWSGKPVGFVSYGAGGGGLRAVQQLREVLASLHMVSVKTSVFLPDASDGFDADRAGRAADAMLRELDWWRHALTPARMRAQL